MKSKSKLLLVAIVTAVTLFFFPKVNFGQAINLGAAANFVIYTTGGSVHDNPVAHSHLTGDVGFFTSGDFLGFGNVDGVMYGGVVPATTACESALQSAAAQINSTSNDYVVGLLLGNGVAFTPGVYSVPGNAVLNLDLVLDAQNVPNSDFIIKINGTLATNAGSKVKLINGAQACHVFWKVEGQIDMATNTTMRGTIIANNAAINMATGDSLEGRLLSTTGAITIDKITAYTPIGCGSPVLTGPPVPDLTSLACYTIFSGIGAIDGSSSSTSIGDVGNANGSITGWTAGVVTGTLHPTGDPSTLQAATDLTAVYNTLNAMVPDIDLLYPNEFGHNLVLTPHVYRMLSGGAFGPAMLTDSVYLDAQNNANAVFVIKITGGPLTTSVNSRVKLINGAQAKNVFWMVNGAVSINDNSIFRGNIVATGAINLWYSGVVLDGRALTMNGAITTAGLAAAMPPGCNVLPCFPEITSEPSDTTVCAGDSALFSVAATGTGLTYQWRKGTLDILGATNDTLIIFPVSIADAASDYNVVVTGTCAPNDTSINVSLIVNAAPIIITEPVNQSACLGDSVSFIVAATGTNLTYQWRKGIVDIPGATNDTLTINPVTITDAALDYNVVITGTCSSDTSINVSLILNSAPIIVTEPLSQTACVGDSISFTVAATGTGLTYQWRVGTVDIIGATNDTLTIDPVALTDAALDYNVVITGTCSSVTSINVSLTVDSTTVISISPVSQIVCVGDSVSFIMVASGTGLTYQWRKGTVNLINGGNITGATSDTLTINPVTLADTASNYNVVVTGSCYAIGLPSMAVPLDSAGKFGILAGTAITSTGNSVISNMDVGLSPGVRSSITGFPPAIVVNGAIYASDDVAPPGVAAMLIQAKQDLTDAYLFAEGATAPAPATVAGDQGGLTLAPGIYKSTSTLLIQSGDLTLDAQGDPNATWIFQIAAGFTTIGGAGGNVILSGGAQAKNVFWQVGSSATIGNGTSFKGTILALTSITMNTGSSIEGRLLARNGAVVLSGTNTINEPSNAITVAFSTTSINVSLTVNSAPVIITEPVSQTACPGDSISFTVAATGSGLTYQWRKGTVDIIGATNDTLTIDPANTINAALDYNVVVTGACSSDTSINVSLTINSAPIIITEPLSLVACAGDSISFTVTAIGTGLTYQWRKGIVDIIGETSSIFTIDPVNITDAALDYNVVVLGTCANDTSINVSLVVNTPPSIATEPTDQTVCTGDSVSFSVIATGTGLSYQWRKGNVNIIGETSATLTINPVSISDAASDYNIIVTGVCWPNDTSINVSLTVNPIPVAVASGGSPVCAGSSLILAAQTVQGGSYLWTGPNTFSSSDQNPEILSATPAYTGTYSLTVSLNGCPSAPSTVNIIVNICVFIPEGFSPNGDGINDFFVIRGIEYYPENSFEIFNRWGNKVFKANPYLNTWDGKATEGLRIGGDELPVGTYFYVLDLGDGSDIYKGTIYLNR